MAKKDNVATVIVGDSKYEIEADTIVNVTTNSGGKFSNLRVTGTSRMGDCLRCVSKKDGIVEIPLKTIATIADAVQSGFPGVKKTARR